MVVVTTADVRLLTTTTLGVSIYTGVRPLIVRFFRPIGYVSIMLVIDFFRTFT